MGSFNSRIKYDQVFKEIAEDFFSEFLSNRVFFRQVGVENSLKDVHRHIRYKRDKTTEFIRYTPDGFACWHESQNKPSYLIEFKSAMTGFKYNNARPLEQMRKKVPDLDKAEIVNIELGSFGNLVSLRKQGIMAVIWIYVRFHRENKWLAIVPDESLNLLSYGRQNMRQTQGSGTPIANVFVRIDNKKVFELSEWIQRSFGCDKQKVGEFLQRQEKRFGDVR